MNQQAPVNFALSHEVTEDRNVLSQGRLHGALARKLALEILRGTYKVGDILPYEHDAPEVMNTSRGPYREAIRILSAKGFVASRPRKGTQVCERTRWNLLDPEVLGWMLATVPSDSYVEGLFELRLINGPAAAELAAERHTTDELSQIRQTLEVMESTDWFSDRRRDAEVEFYKAVLVATHNEVLMSLSGGISAAVKWSNRLTAMDAAETQSHNAHQSRVFQAIETRNGRAARLWMETLIRYKMTA